MIRNPRFFGPHGLATTSEMLFHAGEGLTHTRNSYRIHAKAFNKACIPVLFRCYYKISFPLLPFRHPAISPPWQNQRLKGARRGGGGVAHLLSCGQAAIVYRKETAIIIFSPYFHLLKLLWLKTDE